MSNGLVDITISLSPNASQLIEKYGKTPGLGRSIAKTLNDVNDFTVKEIKKRLNVAGKSKRGKKESRSGAYLYPHKISRNLQSSIGRTLAIIASDPRSGSLEVSSAVGSGVGSNKKAVRYAAIQEFGGTVKIPEKRYSTKELKTRKRRGKDGRRKYRHHGYSVTIPPRSYLLSTFRDRRKIYNERMSDAVIQWFKGKGKTA
jgi:phage gpG-like protein